MRPKISRIDVDVTERENSEVWSGPPKPAVDFHAARGAVPAPPERLEAREELGVLVLGPVARARLRGRRRRHLREALEQRLVDVRRGGFGRRRGRSVVARRRFVRRGVAARRARGVGLDELPQERPVAGGQLAEARGDVGERADGPAARRARRQEVALEVEPLRLRRRPGPRRRRPPAQPRRAGVDLRLGARAVVALGPVPNSNLQLDFNVSVRECFDATSLASLRELDESNRFVQKSAESTSI